MTTSKDLNVLLIEDNIADQVLFKEYLKETIISQKQLSVVNSLEAGITLLQKKPIDILLLDLSLPDSFGLKGFQRIKQLFPQLAIVILTGLSNNDIATDALKSGAQDYLLKGAFEPAVLEKTILYAYERHQLNLVLKKNKQEMINAILQGQEEERKRIARDLHDGLGQILAGVNMHVVALKKYLDTLPDKGKNIYNTIANLTHQAVNETRLISHNLSPNSLQKFGVIKAIGELVHNLNQLDNTLKLEVIENIKDKRFDEKIEVTIYRLLQEIISNTLKHAQAEKLIIHIEKEKGAINLITKDDGKGMVKQNEQNNGLGLTSIKTRVEYLQGHLEIDTELNKGVQYHISIPIRE